PDGIGVAAAAHHGSTRRFHPGPDVLLLDVVVAKIPTGAVRLVHELALIANFDEALAEDPAILGRAGRLQRRTIGLHPDLDLRVPRSHERLQLLVVVTGRGSRAFDHVRLLRGL